jgi:hypothetical protein
MKQIAKALTSLFTPICILALVAGPAQAQTPPTVTYNSDVFQYWHLTGENWKLPPLPPEMSSQVHDYSYSLAMQAAVWGYPLPTFYSLRYNDTLGPKAKAAVNDIWRMTDISTPKLSAESGYVTPNVNTIYGFGFMDLGQEPVILKVPNSHGRYYMVEILDAYSNAFAYAGGIATGYDGGTFALVGPGWKGTLPAGIRRIDSPTRWLLLQPRVHMKSPDDRDGARQVLGEITTTPLHKYMGTAAPPDVKYDYPAPDFAEGLKTSTSANYFKDPLQFWDILSNMLNENPPPQDQITALLPMFAPLGIELGKKWDRTKVNPIVLEAMKEAAANVGMKTLYGIPPGHVFNGWTFCWPSTGNFRTDYLNRAMLVRWGYTANTVEEAIYTGPQFDSEGKPLMGENKYTVTFVPPPFKEPAFWSATMYDYNSNYTVENPINRYSLGSDNKLNLNKDGTVTLYIQATSPGKDKEANWLPSQASGRWYILVRSYAPGRQMIEASFDPTAWNPGPVIQVK